jgi:uncharacterized protein YsxB (DUF464 family)
LVTKDGDRTKIDVGGHSGYASAGKDIVCAGVSVLVQTMIMGLMALAQSYPYNIMMTVMEDGNVTDHLGGWRRDSDAPNPSD